MRAQAACAALLDRPLYGSARSLAAGVVCSPDEQHRDTIGRIAKGHGNFYSAFPIVVGGAYKNR